MPLYGDDPTVTPQSRLNVGAKSIYSLCLSWRQISPQEFAAEGLAHVERLEQEYEKARASLAPYIDKAA